jgi:quercetin dioxygenase-like cupin family protein
MAQYAIIDPELLSRENRHGAPFCVTQGEIWSRSAFPDGFGQFIVYSEVSAGAELRWDEHHGDEGVFVIDGEVEVSGERAGKKGAVLVEAYAPATLRAVTDSYLLHVGSTVPEARNDSIIGAPNPNGHGVHVHGPKGIASAVYEGKVTTTFFSDAHCETCRIALFRVSGSCSIDKPVSHSHSAHELITVIEGELRVGRDLIKGVTTLAIPGNRRYGFITTDDAWEFVNFRLDASYMTMSPRDAPVLETVAAAGTEVTYT